MRNIIINFAASQYEKNGKYGIIKNAGLKITPQRKVVYEVMMELRHAAIDEIIKSVGAPDKPCGVGRADANPKTMLPNDT